MSLWIKICGNTTLEDTQLAVKAGADAVGFVFARSPRQVTIPQVASILAHVAAPVEKIGVFVDTPLDEIYAAVRACGLTGVQLHSDAGPELPAKLRARLGPHLRVLRVVHFDAESALLVKKQIAEHARNPDIAAVLIDSRTAKAVGGTGVAFDWEAARTTVFKNTRTGKRVAAGGLTPANVAEAIAMLRPWEVDVASGVESTPGHKDAHKVREFVAQARAAERKVGQRRKTPSTVR